MTSVSTRSHGRSRGGAWAIIAASAVSAAMASSAPTAAQDQESGWSPPRGLYSFTLENDLFAGADRDYTNGFRIDFVSEPGALTGFGESARDLVAWASFGETWYETFGLGQSLYTPTDIGAPAPLPGERPYAGHLYISYGLIGEGSRTLDTFTIDVGVVGPPSLGEQTQKLVHDIGGFIKPVGWATQLEFEPTIRLFFERQWRFDFDSPIGAERFGLGFDVIPRVQFALGNAETSAGAGLTVRFGSGLDGDWGPPRVAPALGGPGLQNRNQGFRWHVAAGVMGRGIARNLFLEGNSFGGVDGVSISRFVPEFQLGVSIGYGSVDFSYTHVIRDEEYQNQSRFGEFGAFNIRTRF